MLPTHDGQRIRTTMTRWHWDALRWICTATRDKEKYKDLIEFALRGVFEWNVSWDDAMMEVTHSWFDHYRTHLNEKTPSTGADTRDS